MSTAAIMTASCCCGGAPIDSCLTCLQMVWGEEIESVCCRSRTEDIVLKIERPAFAVSNCLSVPTNPPTACPGDVTLTLSYAERDPLAAVYKFSRCRWRCIHPVEVGMVCDPCAPDPSAGYAFKCGSAMSIFGSADPFSPCPANRWSVWRDAWCRANGAAWWADIMCYNGGAAIPNADWPDSPTVFAAGECSRGANDGVSYRLCDYYLCTIHREIVWERGCASGGFGEGDLSLDCITPERVVFMGGGTPIFEMDLLSAADSATWGSAALSLADAEAFICQIRAGSCPGDALMDRVLAHPALMLSTRDWRAAQTDADAANAISFPSEYSGCVPQTDTLGPSRHACWPAIRAELMPSEVAALQPDCLPTPTAPMIADPAWRRTRYAYLRTRPGAWYWECANESACNDGPWAGQCLRFDGAPFGAPSCSAVGPSGCGCDWTACICSGSCDACPPTLAANMCATPAECSYLMAAASCDGVLFVFGYSFWSDCHLRYTCVAQPPDYDCDFALAQGWRMPGSRTNRAWLYPVRPGCEETGPSPYACVPQTPATLAPLLGRIEAAAPLAFQHGRVIYIALDGGNCPDAGRQCDECPEVGTADRIPASVTETAPCGTYVAAVDPCDGICWTADPCDGPCPHYGAELPCYLPPPDPCP
jgi:hypothetical protein